MATKTPEGKKAALDKSQSEEKSDAVNGAEEGKEPVRRPTRTTRRSVKAAAAAAEIKDEKKAEKGKKPEKKVEKTTLVKETKPVVKGGKQKEVAGKPDPKKISSAEGAPEVAGKPDPKKISAAAEDAPAVPCSEGTDMAKAGGEDNLAAKDASETKEGTATKSDDDPEEQEGQPDSSVNEDGQSDGGGDKSSESAAVTEEESEETSDIAAADITETDSCVFEMRTVDEIGDTTPMDTSAEGEEEEKKVETIPDDSDTLVLNCDEKITADAVAQKDGISDGATTDGEAANLPAEQEKKEIDGNMAAEKSSTDPGKEKSTGDAKKKTDIVKDDKKESSEKSSADDKTKKITPAVEALWVSGLSSRTRAADLKALFSKHGKVTTAKIVTNSKTPGARCFGFLTMASSKEIEACIKHLHHTELQGRIISVEKTTRDLSGSTKRVSSQDAPGKKQTAPARKTTHTTEHGRKEGDKKVEEKKPDASSAHKPRSRTGSRGRHGSEKKKDLDAEKNKEAGKDAEGKVKEEVEGESKSSKEKDPKSRSSPATSRKSSDARQSDSSKKRSSKERSKSKEPADARKPSRERRRTRSRSPVRRNRRSRSPLVRSRVRGNSRDRYGRVKVTRSRFSESRSRSRSRERNRWRNRSPSPLHLADDREEELRKERQRELERRNRDETRRLERERERLRLEKENLERERAKVLHIEKENQRIERLRIKREMAELRTLSRLSATAGLAVKRPFELESVMWKDPKRYVADAFESTTSYPSPPAVLDRQESRSFLRESRDDESRRRSHRSERRSRDQGSERNNRSFNREEHSESIWGKSQKELAPADWGADKSGGGGGHWGRMDMPQAQRWPNMEHASLSQPPMAGQQPPTNHPAPNLGHLPPGMGHLPPNLGQPPPQGISHPSNQVVMFVGASGTTVPPPVAPPGNFPANRFNSNNLIRRY